MPKWLIDFLLDLAKAFAAKYDPQVISPPTPAPAPSTPPVSVDDVLMWLLKLEDRTLEGKIIDLGDGAGLTRFGITQKWFKSALPADFWSPTLPTGVAIVYAKLFYRRHYWDDMGLSEFHDITFAASVLSCAVNMGTAVAQKLLRESAGHQQFIAAWIAAYDDLVKHSPDDAKFLKGWRARANAIFPALP